MKKRLRSVNLFSSKICHVWYRWKEQEKLSILVGKDYDLKTFQSHSKITIFTKLALESLTTCG